MIRRLCALAVGLSVGCSGNSNSLYGSESQVYNLSFNSVVIVLQQDSSSDSISIKYIGQSGDPAILVVDLADIENVAGSSIDLTQLDQGQQRGVLQNVNGAGDGLTNDLTIVRGTVVFDQVPKVKSKLSGEFNATLSDGYTLDGTFSGTVNAP
jgi:hypothetical protein